MTMNRIIHDAGENEFWRYVVLEETPNGIYRERFAATILEDAMKIIEDTTWGDTLHSTGLTVSDKKVKNGKKSMGNSRTVNGK